MTTTVKLMPGDQVMTTVPDGSDFGLPLVSPTHRPGRGAVVREVRGRVKVQGGFCVWFQDGTKTRPTHGRTDWLTQ